MTVLVSACVVGDNCKYNGKNNYSPNISQALVGHKIIKICPELLAKMSIPRKSAEIVDGIVKDIDGKNVDKEYRLAVELALKYIENMDIDVVILQSRSPTCGVNSIYDGSFTGKLITGQGLFAKALIEAGYKVKDVEDFMDDTTFHQIMDL
ncbi:MAG: DUF523 domain-containing protein [Lachnospiraceae bacterium]|nr:DUF523 domain-containing protein [Lachnospiraceae bacterium]